MSDVRSELRQRVLAAYKEPCTVEDVAKALGQPLERIGPATYALKRKKLLKEVGDRGQYKLFQTTSRKETTSQRVAEKVETGTLTATLERISRELVELAGDIEVFSTHQTTEVDRLKRENNILRRTIADLQENK